MAVHIAAMAQLQAEGNFKMYHTNMASTLIACFLRLKDETSWRAMGGVGGMMYINFIPFEWKPAIVTSRSK